MGLFGKSEDKAAQSEAARVEIERLCAMTPRELAREVMPAFGPHGPRAGKEINVLQISSWLMRSQPGAKNFFKQLHQPVCEAVQILEHAALVQILAGERGSIANGAHIRATRAGEAALAKGEFERQTDVLSAG